MMRNIYSSKMNKRASHGDHFFGFAISKKGQFFILSAVIIASIIVSMVSVKNFISTGDAPKKFYYYSQQLDDEMGAVVDYALYSDPTGNNATVKANLNKFLQQSIEKTLAGDDNIEIISCYSNTSDSNTLICQNNGTRDAWINVSLLPNDRKRIAGSKVELRVSGILIPSTRAFYIKDKTVLTITPNGSASYNIPLGNSSIQRGQFYFMLKMNTTSGNYVSDSTGVKQI